MKEWFKAGFACTIGVFTARALLGIIAGYVVKWCDKDLETLEQETPETE